MSGLSWDRLPVLPAGLIDTRHEYRHLASIYLPIAIGVFVLVILVMLAVALIYWRRPPHRAARWHENNIAEGSYALLLIAVVAFLLVLTYTTEHRVDTVANREPPAQTLDVTGSKWEWTFSYPRYGITLRSGTVGHEPLVVPTGQAIRINLTSVDVIHAFWIPHTDYKHDAFPGSTQVITLTFPQPGVFQGECAQFCGTRHADMLFTVHAVSPQAFASWAARGGRGPTP